MKKPVMLSLIALLVFVLALAGCSNGSKTNGAAQTIAPAESDKTPDPTAAPPAKKEKIVFYGDIVEFPTFKPMLAKLKEDFKDKYDIQTIPVDWGNITQVVKTGIASGTPADIYVYWPSNLGPHGFLKSNSVMDLTPALDANDGEWRKSFNSMLNTGKYGDKNYGIPISGVFPTMYVNQDILDKAGVTIPENWNWEQFIEIMKQVKQKTGIYPFGLSSDPTIAPILAREGLMSLGKSANKLDDLFNLTIPATDPMFTTMLTNIKKLYDADVWYPGKGALTIKRDEEQSAFFQGKVAFLPEASSVMTSIVENSKFKVGVVPLPTMGDKLGYSGGSDGFFIPANAPHKDAAIEILKKFTSPEYQQIHADGGFLVSSSNVKISNPAVDQLAKSYENVISNPPSFFSTPKLTDYVNTQLLAKLLLGGSKVEEIEKDIEALRQEGLKSK